MIVATPAVPPITKPPELIDAVPDELVLHVPPPVKSDKVVVLPLHKLIGVVGKIAVGVVFTTTNVVA